MDEGKNEAACGVCRHLGKQCDEDCILGPYFPQQRSQEFKYVHKVFGIHNLTQIISSVEEHERATAIETLIIEAKMRVHDKVHGAYGVERNLRAQWSNAVKELNLLNHHLRFLSRGLPPFDREPGPSNRCNYSDLKGKRKM